MVVIVCFIHPLSKMFNTDAHLPDVVVRLIVMVLSIIGYIVLHEAVHGVAMKLCGTKRVRFGVTGLYAYAGSDDYYSKSAYIFIALAPVVLWGIVLAVLCAVLPASWFWIVYLVEIMNISGAAGDFFVTFRFIQFPSDILVKDAGVSMTVYSGTFNK